MYPLFFVPYNLAMLSLPEHLFEHNRINFPVIIMLTIRYEYDNIFKGDIFIWNPELQN